MWAKWSVMCWLTCPGLCHTTSSASPRRSSPPACSTAGSLARGHPWSSSRLALPTQASSFAPTSRTASTPQPGSTGRPTLRIPGFRPVTTATRAATPTTTRSTLCCTARAPQATAGTTTLSTLAAPTSTCVPGTCAPRGSGTSTLAAMACSPRSCARAALGARGSALPTPTCT